MATLTVPADYLEDVRRAAVTEVASDTDALRTADPQDREMSMDILQRSLRLLDPLLTADGDVELTGEQDNRSNPIIHMLEELIRQLVKRLEAVAQYGPMTMGDVLDLAAQLRWAAEETIRIDPSAGDRMSPESWKRAMDEVG